MSTNSFDITSKQMLINLINAENWQQFKEADLVFGTPTLLDPAVTYTRDGITRNTSISVKGTGTTKLSTSDEITLHYNRVELNTLFSDLTDDDPLAIAISGSETTLFDILGYVEQTYNLKLTADDIENVTLPTSLPADVAFAATADSFGYTGSVTINISVGAQPLEASPTEPKLEDNQEIGEPVVDGEGSPYYDLQLNDGGWMIDTTSDDPITNKVALRAGQEGVTTPITPVEYDDDSLDILNSYLSEDVTKNFNIQFAIYNSDNFEDVDCSLVITGGPTPITLNLVKYSESSYQFEGDGLIYNVPDVVLNFAETGTSVLSGKIIPGILTDSTDFMEGPFTATLSMTGSDDVLLTTTIHFTATDPG